MPQLITIGETMAAFTPDSVGALRYVQNFGIRTAGAESNVAVGLAKLGLEAAWVSRLGTDEFGCFIRNQLRAEGVDCSRVIYDPDHRTGIMFKETGVGETKVFYYRENSAASHLCPEDVTPALLDGVKVLLCHKPEHYIKFMRGRALDLVVAGHAHGGQIRVAGRGVFSPGQGLFPRYTYGVVDGRMVISAGAGNPVHLPRWGNPCEVLRVTLD